MSTQIRVVRKTLFAPREGRQLLFSDGHAGDHRLPDDVHEGTFNPRRSRRHARCKDGVYVFCMDIGKLRGALEHAELPRGDLVEACVETGIATPSSRRHIDGVEVDAKIQHERAVKF